MQCLKVALIYAQNIEKELKTIFEETNGERGIRVGYQVMIGTLSNLLN